MIEKCIKHDITIYAAHTNLDVAQGGVNDLLADKLSLMNTKVLDETYAETLYKFIVFCPKTHADEMRQALGKAGAGAIGDYTACSFTTNGKVVLRQQKLRIRISEKWVKQKLFLKRKLKSLYQKRLNNVF